LQLQNSENENLTIITVTNSREIIKAMGV